VHIIAHTHDDVGWLKTVDEYYIGSNQSIQNAGVQYILDSTIDQLVANPNRKFIYVEIAFFERWWYEQTEFRKQTVRNLVSEGRLEFINGGYCMNDEATTHYQDIIDQMTLGHLFLYREFGVRPRIGWHIDPFGHAISQASLFAQMGFDAFFFARIDYRDREIRRLTKQMEFVWENSPSLGSQTDIFSTILYGDYCYLTKFAFEGYDAPIQDDPRLFDYNVKERADLFATEVRQRAQAFKSNQMMVFLGCDFQFQNAIKNFKNMDKLMAYINSNSDTYKLNVIYSTPSIYIDAIHSEGLTWNTYAHDFLPYGSDAHEFWTGFYTSRPSLKGYVRTRSNLLHASNKLFTISSFLEFVNTSNYLSLVSSLWKAQAILQHHDAVSGTENHHVALDYAKRLSIGTANAEFAMHSLMTQIAAGNSQENSLTFESCQLLNISRCPLIQELGSNASIAVVLYNHLGWARTEYIKLPVFISNVQVLDNQGLPVASQVYQNFDESFNLIFQAELSPFGFNTYFISASENEFGGKLNEFVDVEYPNGDITINNDFLSVTFSGNSSLLASITNKNLGKTMKVKQNIHWWNSSTGNDEFKQAGGAYIFRPNSTTSFSFSKPKIEVVNGELVQEVHQTWTPWVKQVVRLFKGASHLEVESFIGPIEIYDRLGKDIVSRYETSLQTDNTWYTDSQGLEIQKRMLNYRPYNHTNTEPIASNYYPYNEATFIQDTKQDLQFTIVSDRSRGCTSLANGELEIMLHRRLLVPDLASYLDPLNDEEPIRTLDHVTLDSLDASPSLMRSKALLMSNPVIPSFSVISDVGQYINTYQTQFSNMKNEFPPNLHLLNFDTLENGDILLRLHHLYAIDEDSILSQPITIDLNEIFEGIQFSKITEMTLTGNRPKDQLHRLQWKTKSEMQEKYEMPINLKDSSMQFTRKD